MLIEVRIENFRSIRDEQALTLEAGPIGDAEDPRPRTVPGHREKLLAAAALYGANASGKSNVLTALGFMQDAVLRSHHAWAPDGGVPRQPFAWDGKPAEPTLCEATFLLDGARYQYGFTADGERFLEEWLYAWPRRRKQVWFERDGDEFSFGEKLHGENRLVEQVTRPNSLFLSAAVQLSHGQLRPVYDWFRSVRLIDVEWKVGSDLRGFARAAVQRWQRVFALLDSPLPEASVAGLLKKVQPDEGYRDSTTFLRLLQAADIGILDIREEDRGPSGRPEILLQHRENPEEAWLSLQDESQGTQTLFRIGPPTLEALEKGSLVLVDELESSLHPLLATALIRLFNGRETNPNGAQLIFATHDSHLLGNLAGDTALRRDQIWLTEKDTAGATSLYPLTDFRPRKAENLERGYLQGRYGGVPFLGGLMKEGTH